MFEYNDENLKQVRKEIEEECENNNDSKDIEVTEESRKNCVEALLK